MESSQSDQAAGSNLGVHKKRMRGTIKDLGLPEASQRGACLEETLVVRRESPWETFMKVYECDLAGPLAIASPRVRPTRLVAIRTLRSKDTDKMLCLLRDIQHPNVLSSQVCFLYEETLFVLYNDIQISLDHLIACDAYLNEVELAAVLAQVLDGLLYLNGKRLAPSRLTPLSILATGAGEIKIGAPEEFVEIVRDQSPTYWDALRLITMELMQKYGKEGGKTGVDDVGRWPCDSRAVGFLSSLSSEIPIAQLRQHALFIQTQWCKGHLQGLVSFALRSSFTYCSYCV